MIKIYLTNTILKATTHRLTNTYKIKMVTLTNPSQDNQIQMKYILLFYRQKR